VGAQTKKKAKGLELWLLILNMPSRQTFTIVGIIRIQVLGDQGLLRSCARFLFL